MDSRTPARAVKGAEYAPIPPGAQVWRWHPLGRWQRSRHLAGPDESGPHIDAGHLDPVYIVADLVDVDTALLVLRRLLATPSPPLRAHTLVQRAMSGRWADDDARTLGRLCLSAWSNNGGEVT